jgi:hypothetical protein
MNNFGWKFAQIYKKVYKVWKKIFEDFLFHYVVQKINLEGKRNESYWTVFSIKLFLINYFLNNSVGL